MARMLLASLWMSLWITMAQAEEKPDSSGFDKVRLHVGESTLVAIPDEQLVQLSRRGVVDISAVGGGQWRVTGLKPGFVIVNFSADGSDEEGSGVSQYFVEVLKAPKELGSLPPWACMAPVRCGTDGVVQGSVDDPRLFFRVRAACMRMKDCYFLAVLSSIGIERWRDQLRFALPADEIQILPDGSTRVMTRCPDGDASQAMRHKRDITQLFHDNALDGVIIPVCNHAQLSGEYRVEAKVVLVEDDHLKEAGLDHPWLDGTALWSQFSTPMVDSGIRSHRIAKKLQIIGEPVVTVSAGAPARVQSGGELPYVTISNKAEPGVGKTVRWKEYGLDLKISIYPRSKDEVGIAYSFILSKPVNNGEGGLKRHAIESRADIKIAEPTLVGSVKLNHDESQEEDIPFLRKVPIVGPIFKAVLEQQTENHLALVIKIEPLPSVARTTTSGNPDPPRSNVL